jgi:hypothetical protein
MVYNAVSAMSVISKVYRDLNIDDPSFELDAIEWIGEALDWIGAGVQQVDKEEWVVATNHTAPLPSDCQYLKGVYFVNNPPLKDDWEGEPMPYDLENVENKRKILLERSDQTLHDGIGGDSTNLPKEQSYGDSEYQTIWQDLQGLEGDQNPDFNSIGHNYQETYFLNGNQIKTSFSEGLLLIAYKGIPIDENGYPLIPDDVAYREACFWYIAKKLALGGHNISTEFSYEMASQMWNKRCTQARNRANYPDMDEYEKFLQSWVQMANTREFNKSYYPYDQEDQRTDQDTSQYRITEEGVQRITD